MKILEIDQTISKRLQAIAVLMMIFHHTFGFPQRLLEGVSYIGIPVGGGNSEVFIGQMCKICVSIFAFITGYAFARKKQWTWGYIVRKIMAIVILYWIALIVFILCNFFDVNTYSFKQIFLNIILLKSDINHASW